MENPGQWSVSSHISRERICRMGSHSAPQGKTMMTTYETPMVKAHGRGPIGVFCRHCEHFHPVDGRPSICWHPEAWGQVIASTHPPCGLYHGPSGTVIVTCPNPDCGARREIHRISHEHAQHSPFCRTCSARMRRTSESKIETKKKPTPPAPVFNGCFPVRTKEGAKRPKCLGNSILEQCPSYGACLEYACKMKWSGFRNCGKEGGDCGEESRDGGKKGETSKT